MTDTEQTKARATVAETLESLREHLAFRQGSTIDVATWTSRPNLSMKYREGGFIHLMLDGEELDMHSLPSEQIINLAYTELNSGWSSSHASVRAMLDWMECEHEELEVTNAELFDMVWVEKNMARLSRHAHQVLENVHHLRHMYQTMVEHTKEEQS